MSCCFDHKPASGVGELTNSESSCQSNKKNDFKLTAFKTRCKERYLFYALLTAIAVHVDTWLKQDKEKKRACPTHRYF